MCYDETAIVVSFSHFTLPQTHHADNRLDSCATARTDMNK